MTQPPIDPDEAQKITIESYNQHVSEYLDKRRKQGDRTVAYWPGVEYFLRQLQSGQTIFEIGSGSGADAMTIEELGYSVRRSDVTQSFLEILSGQGYSAEFYNVLNGPHPEKFHAIFAGAVLLHFDVQQLRQALHNIQLSLLPGGLFCVSVKLGDFEGWREKGLSGKRYFKFWRLGDFEDELTKAHLKILNSFVTPLEDFAVITVSS